MRQRTRWFVLIACVAVCHVGIAAGDEQEGQASSASLSEAINLLNTWIEAVVDFDRLPGLSLAIVHDQDLVYARGFGLSDVERSVRATPDTAYGICSMTKMLTAIAVMQLRDEGKLSLDDPVANYLSWFAPKSAGPDDSLPPTLADLLRHSSGLPCEADRKPWSDPDLLYPSREELVDRASSLELSYPTNTSFNYSNLGYALLGEVVSVVSGMEYEEYVQLKILEPIGMTSTMAFPPAGPVEGEVAVGYGRRPRTGARVKIKSRSARAITPARGFTSTVRDMAKFAMWQFRVLGGASDGVLGRESLSEMQTAQWSAPEWGYGFAIWRMNDTAFIGHQGGCPGYKSQIILCPKEKIAVVAMINATDAPQFTLVFRAFEIVAPALAAPVAEDRPRRWTDYTGYYTADEAWSEAEVVEWGGSLAVMWVPTPDPLGSLVKLRRVEGNVFRQVGNDGTVGKHYVFGTDAEGHVVAMKFNDNLLRKTMR